MLLQSRGARSRARGRALRAAPTPTRRDAARDARRRRFAGTTQRTAPNAVFYRRLTHVMGAIRSSRADGAESREDDPGAAFLGSSSPATRRNGSTTRNPSSPRRRGRGGGRPGRSIHVRRAFGIGVGRRGGGMDTRSARRARDGVLKETATRGGRTSRRGVLRGGPRRRRRAPDALRKRSEEPLTRTARTLRITRGGEEDLRDDLEIDAQRSRRREGTATRGEDFEPTPVSTRNSRNSTRTLEGSDARRSDRTWDTT